MPAKWVEVATSAWLASIGIAAVFFLAQMALSRGINGTVTAAAFVAVATLGAGTAGYRLVKKGK